MGKDLHKIEYRKNFIDSVICRIDFSPILKISKEISPDFQEGIKEYFPQLKEEDVFEFRKLMIDEKDISEQRIVKKWVFSNSQEKRHIRVTYNFLSIEFKQYDHFSNFIKIVENVFNIFLELYKPTLVDRLGLRYINIIKLAGDPFKWSKLINQSLIYSIDNFIDNINDLSRAMNQIAINREDYKITFNYGLLNSEYPGNIARKEYVLDYDCFANQVEYPEVIKLLELFNKDIKILFEKCIEDGLRNIMEVLS